jgi:sulfite exporter TauE/SafE
MAVVAGLALSMSAVFAREGKKLKPQLLFHAGRLISFFVFGGVIGAIGSTFAFTGGTAIVLCVVIAIATLIVAANLLGASNWSKRIQPSMPTWLAQYAHGASKLYQTVTPCVIGMATFFLPCVITQSMQLYALSTGNFLSGALTMGSFALGTLPMLALVGFTPVAFRSGINTGVIAKSAGLIIILIVLYNVPAVWQRFV